MFSAGVISAQVISNVAVSGVTSQSAVITWTTNLPANSLVNYGLTTSYGSSSTLDSTQTTLHSVTVNGLAANTLYNFNVASAAGAISPVVSANSRFATLSLAPVISNINTIFVSSTAFTVNWTTDQPSTGMVNYGPTTAYGFASSLNSTPSTTHSVSVTGLTPAITYNFAVVSAGQAGVASTSANQTVITASPTATAPNTTPISTSNINYSTATISWSTDVPSSSALAYGTTEAFGQITPVQTALTTSHQVVLTNLYKGTTYYVIGMSAGSGGAIGFTIISNFTTAGPHSLVPVINNVVTSNLTSTSATITWTTDAPSTSQVNYGTTTGYGSSSPLIPTLTTSHSVTLTGLSPATLYDIQLVSASTGGVAYFGANMAGITVWAWGDSLTSGGEDGAGTSYPLYLSTDLGIPVANEGVGGTTSIQIAQLMLSTPAAFPTGNCNIFWPGRNNHNQVSQILSDIASMVNALSVPACYLVMGDINATNELVGTTDYQNIVTTDTSEASLYGTDYIDIREALVQAYNPVLALDVADHTGDAPPASLRVVSPQGTITSGALDSASCTFSVSSNATQGVGTVVIIDSETILINAMADPLDVTACTRGYNGTAAASHAANAVYSFIDPLHLASNGLELVATQVAAWFQQRFPLNFTTPQTSPSQPVISAVAVSSITSSSAVVTWTTDQATTSQVNYGATSAYGLASMLNATLATSHTVTLTGLIANTTYNFDVLSANGGGTTAMSPNATFTTLAATPVITLVTATAVSATSETITWTTDQATSSEVNYGPTSAYGSSSPLISMLATSHSVTLTGLIANTTYNFEVVSANAGSTAATSPNATFTTPFGSPVVTLVTATAVSATSETITWTTDQATSSEVNYGPTSAYGSSSTLISMLATSHSVTLTGLIANTTYNFEVVSANAGGTTATSSNATFTTPFGSPVITMVTATAVSSTSETITWTTDQAATSQVKFGATSSYGSASALNSTLSTTHSVTLTGLTANTTYNFDVVSANASGTTAVSPNATFLTQAGTPVITLVMATAVSPTSETITWTTDQATTSQVNYGTTSSYGSASVLTSTLATTHSVTLTGLTANTTCNFDVVSTNAGGTSAISPNATFTTSAIIAPVISAVAVANLTVTSATITWSTDQPATAQVNYGTSPTYGTLTTATANLATTQAVTLTGLQPGTTYFYQAISSNSFGASSVASNYTFTTHASSGTPPFVGYVAFWGVNNTGVTISWSTDLLADTELAIGTSPTNLGSPIVESATLTNNHGIVLTNLSPGTTYYFQPVSQTAAGGIGQSATVYSFTTTGMSTTPPVISNVVSTPSSGSVMITWTTDQPSSTTVNYGVTPSYGVTYTGVGNTTSHSVTLTGLLSGTPYYFQVMSGVSSANGTFNTSGSPPPEPVITNVAAASVTATTAVITWTTDQPGSSLVNYGTSAAYGSASTLTTSLVTSHSITLTGLTPNSSYDFAVVSQNASAMSSTSSNYTFTTTPVSTAPAPYVGYVAYWGVGNSGVTISWSTDLPADTELSYGVSSTNLPAPVVESTTLAASHGIVLTGLNSGTTYYFQCVSKTAAGGIGTSSTYSFTTTGTATTPPTISNLLATPANNSATITWTTDQPSSSSVNYGTTTSYGTTDTGTSGTTSHSLTLTGLLSGTPYYFQVVSGVSNASGTFTTTGSVMPGPVISQVAATAVTASTAIITWTTDQPSTSQVNYGSATTTLIPALVTSHSVMLSGLTPGTSYTYSVVSGTTTSPSSIFTTSPATGTPPVVSYVAFWGVTATGVNISWSTNLPATTQLNYGTSASLGTLTAPQTALTISHGIVLSGLTPGTTYSFVAQSTDATGDIGYSTTYSFTTLAGPPSISGITASPMSGNKATIAWTTSVPTQSYVKFGQLSGSYTRYSVQTSLTTSPACMLGYVPSGTTYYQLVSTDANGNQTVSAEMTFIEP